jgi:putative hydrolase of the HAD superfamily
MAGKPTRAILLDCLGTLVRLEPPAPRLAHALGIPLVGAERAMRAEIAYYRRHMHEARDRTSLAGLRARCAAIVSDELGLHVDVPTLLAALEFTPYPDVRNTLERWRARDMKLVVVSNWDVSLHEVLDRCDLTRLLDGAVSSAEVGAAKPDPAPVLAGLAIAGVAAGEAVLIGDDPEADLGAAEAAGVRAILLDRTAGEELPSDP